MPPNTETAAKQAAQDATSPRMASVGVRDNDTTPSRANTFAAISLHVMAMFLSCDLYVYWMLHQRDNKFFLLFNIFEFAVTNPSDCELVHPAMTPTKKPDVLDQLADTHPFQL
jgi:hypothetical protein